MPVTWDAALPSGAQAVPSHRADLRSHATHRVEVATRVQIGSVVGE